MKGLPGGAFHLADRERTLMAICERLKAPIGDDL